MKTKGENMENPRENLEKQLEKTFEYLKIEEGTKKILKKPKRIVSVSLPVRMDNGEIKVFEGHRVMYNDAKGPAKGGIRYHPNVCVDEVTALAGWMMLKNSLLDLPYGGGKGGIKVNPEELSKQELERLSRAYVRALYEVLGEEKDVPAPDVYTNSQIMAWMYDEYSTIARKDSKAMITSKPLEIGGSKGREYSTSLGGLYVLEEALKEKGIENPTIIIQGCGNVGLNAAKFFEEKGWEVISICDSKTTLYNKEGLDLKTVIDTKEKCGSLSQCKCEKIENNKQMELEADVLVPAAMENMINEKNADKIKVKIILELANGPVTPEADEILNKKGIMIIPDILANSGGVVGSYFEWVQNRTGEYWEKEDLDKRLEKRMKKAFRDVLQKAKEKKTDLRTGAQILAIERIAKAQELRGI